MLKNMLQDSSKCTGQRMNMEKERFFEVKKGFRGKGLSYLRGRKKDGQPFWVEFRYEKLPMFSCYCGFIGHEQKSCIKQSKDMENRICVVDSQYGNWLRASPGKSAGWKKFGPGGNRWSPGKSGNSKPDNHRGNRGLGPYRNPDMV